MSESQESFNLVERLESQDAQIEKLQFENAMLKIRLSNLRLDMLRMRSDFSIYVSRMMTGPKQRKMS